MVNMVPFFSRARDSELFCRQQNKFCRKIQTSGTSHCEGSDGFTVPRQSRTGMVVVLTAGYASSWAKDGDDDDPKCEQMNYFIPFSLEN